jgi:CDP-diacylglycerol--serine O-phosphatidyltransferase
LGVAAGPRWLFFATCAALRLARFNAAIDPPDPEPAWRRNFFTGVPAPAAGGLAMFWLFLALATGWEAFASPWLNAGWLVGVGLLMISRLPTYSLKRARLRREWALPAMLAVALTAAAVISLPWWSLTAISAAYLASLPLAARSARRAATRRAEARRLGGCQGGRLTIPLGQTGGSP